MPFQFSLCGGDRLPASFSDIFLLPIFIFLIVSLFFDLLPFVRHYAECAACYYFKIKVAYVSESL